MTADELRHSTEYKYHHTGSRRGYESRRGDGHVEPYKGIYGTGYIHIWPRWDTTQYVDVRYYIAQPDRQEGANNALL